MARLAAIPLVLIAASFTAPAGAQTVLAGTGTHGGAVPGGQVIHVASLADTGPGTLRAAIRTPGSRVIVFDVAGIIPLKSDLKIETPDITIAGQTAPPPGITLTGASLRVRTHDVVIQHIAVRPGPSGSAQVNGNRDAITVGGGKEDAYDVRLENVSTTWSVDEAIDINGAATHNVTVRNSIIAEALRNAGHPKGDHSMGMLINDGAQAVAVTGNLFASNMFRNPVMARGVSAFVAYNSIVNPADNAIHFYSPPRNGALKATVIGNVVTAGRDTRSNVTAVQIPADMALVSPDARIYLTGNVAAAGPLTNPGGFRLASTPPVRLAIPIRPPADVRSWVQRYAGPEPAARNAVDARIVAQASEGTSHIIDDPSQVGGLPDKPPVSQPANVPPDPFGRAANGGPLRIEAWLCERHLEMGGPQTPQCPQNLASYRNMLDQRQAERSKRDD